MSQETKPIVKKYSLSKEEKLQAENYTAVMGMLAIQRQGVSDSLHIMLQGVRARVGKVAESVPEGYERSMSFDPNSYEIVITDMPITPKPEEPKAQEKQVN